MYENLLSRVYNCPHLVRPEKLEAVRKVVTQRALGIHADAALVQAVVAESRQAAAVTVNRSVAVLPIVGTLAKRMGMVEESSGGTSTDRIGRDFDRLISDDTVGAVVLEIDSPGGESAGVPELANKIFQARGKKPICASVNAAMASAALWIGEAADSVSITPSGMAGSHGVYIVHTDFSKWNEENGVAFTYVSAGPHKVELASDHPLAEETRAYLQAQVDAIYEEFTADLARFRGLTKSQVKSQFGGGRMLRADEAKSAGMIDRIETLDETIARLAGNGPKRRSAKALIENQRAKLRLAEFE